eukprot:gene7462-9169_t
MSSFKDTILSFKTIIPDILMLVVTLVGSILLLTITPILHLINLFRNKSFPPPKTIVITGASSGIGKGVAIAYAAPNINLMLVGRNKERLEEVKTICSKKGANVTTLIADITDRQTMKNHLLSYDAKYPIDVLIANAGISEQMLPKDKDYEDRTREIMDINIYGVMNTIHPILPNMRKRQHGQIVLLSSLSTYLTYIFPAYVGSKGAITSYGLTLRGELKPYGIGVTVVAPGFVKTRMSESLRQKNLPLAIDADQSAQYILEGIKENKAFVGYNLPTLLFCQLVNIIPPNLRDAWNTVNSIVFKSEDTIMYTSSSNLSVYSTASSSNGSSDPKKNQ